MKDYSKITPYISFLAEKSIKNNLISPEMYLKHDVKRGLRDLDGNGVVAGLTEISSIKAKEISSDGAMVPCEGQLHYRGYNIKELTDGFLKDSRFGFEETVYLLLFSELPDNKTLQQFSQTLAGYRSLPTSFVRDLILKAPCNDIMNILARSVLALYTYDNNPNDISIENVLRQCLQLIAMFPLLSVYGYQSYQHYYNFKSLSIHHPKKELSTAENILYLLRGEGNYTDLEAKILDLALVLHAEHGGGNNSTFTTHVVTSSGTDTYSAIAAALGSLKGPRHGGANIKVVQMFEHMKKTINVNDKGQINDYLADLLDKKTFDNAGLIYGIGHAIYSKSDPRADILKSCAYTLAKANGFEEDFELYSYVAQTAPEIVASKRKMYKGISPNVDFYSGLIYKMLQLPCELFTPLFAMSRISGWSAHRLEELQNSGKIIRPAYISVKEEKRYVSLNER